MTSTLASPPLLGVVICGAGPAGEAGTLVRLAQTRGWRVSAITTPAGLGFVDATALEELTRNPVRTQYRTPDQPRVRSLPDPDAIIVAPATFNTIGKLAHGIADTYALSVLAEAIGRAVPVVIAPFVNTALAGRRPYIRALQALTAEGVHILGDADGCAPHTPGTGNQRIPTFPWQRALEVAEQHRTPAR